MLQIAVIGKEGQLARSVAVAAAALKGVSVTCIGRPQLDLREATSVAAALSGQHYDVVINAAAYTMVDRAEAQAQEAFAINRDGAGAIAAACEAQEAALIHVSTDYVFDGSKPDAWTESDPCNPQTIYGRSKYEGEQAVLHACRRAVILRTAWLHSPYGSNFVKTMLRLSRERERLRVVADQRGSPTYVPDLAAAVLAMAQRVGSSGRADLFGIFHLAGFGHATWHELAEAALAASAAAGGQAVPVDPITTAEYPTPARRPANSMLATAKVEAVYGLKLPPWRDGVRRCVSAVLAGEAALRN